MSNRPRCRRRSESARCPPYGGRHRQCKAGAWLWASHLRPAGAHRRDTVRPAGCGLDCWLILPSGLFDRPAYHRASWATAATAASISSSVLKGEKLKRTAPCSRVPRAWWSRGAQWAPGRVAMPQPCKSASDTSPESRSRMFRDTMAARQGAEKSPYTRTPGSSRTPR